MSSPYVTLDNRSLEQWKVIELKEELKKRKLTTKGLKEDLLKRLDEAVRIERANATVVEDDDATQTEEHIEQRKMESISCGKDKDPISIGMSDTVDSKSNHDCQQGTLSEVSITEANVGKGDNAAGIEEYPVETTPMIGEMVEPVTTLSGSNLSTDGKDKGQDSTAVLNNDELPPFLEDAKLDTFSPNDQKPQLDKDMHMASTEPDFHDSKTQNEGVHLTGQMEIDDSKHHQINSSFQVSEVNPNFGLQVTFDLISTEAVSVIEKNELEEDVITDNIQLELDIKHEEGQAPASSDAPHGGEFHPSGTEGPPVKTDHSNPLAENDAGHPAYEKDDKEPDDTKDVEQPVGKKASKEMTIEINADSADGLKNVHTVDLGPEKLSLDQSSGDDAIEEDILDGKQTEYKSDSNKSNDNVEKAEKGFINEDDHVDVVGHDKPVEMTVASTENKTVFGQAPVKRKFDDNEAAGHNDTMKKTRRWNTENLKGSGQQSNLQATASPKGFSVPFFKCTGTEPGVHEGTPKERIVPPSSKAPTNSLRIDRFLRPFTLKAVQELLGKTGTVTSFWMDHIKTHCYVSYSSIEEAVETRNAVYNIQWPPNGGRFLVAEFVDPQEVKTRLEAPPASPATPTGSVAGNIATSKTQSVVPQQPSPLKQVVKQQLPPPPLSSPSVVKEWLHPARESLPREHVPASDRLNILPPPPEKIDPPIVTLDDLFRKTRATPRIYYLPLGDEEVRAKQKSQGKNVNQSAGVACRMFQLRGGAGAVSVISWIALC